VSLKKFLTTAEVTNFFGIEEGTVRALVETGDLKALADRGTWKYRRDDIEALIKAGRLHPTKEMPTVDDMDFDETMGFGDSSSADDRVDFLELDEEALAGESTMISGGAPAETNDLRLSFTEEPAGSASDVRVFTPSDSLSSDSDIQLRGTSGEVPRLPGAPSSSDVQVVPEVAAGDSSQYLQSLEGVDLDRLGRASLTGQEIPVEGIVLDLDDESSGKLQQPSMGGTQRLARPEMDLPAEFADEFADENTFIPSGGTSRLEIPTGGTSRMEPPVDLPTRLELPHDFPAEAESVLGDEGLATSEGDSGLTFENTDSGLTLDTGDSGLTMDAGDSGLTLDAGDSGLTLDAGDSGLSLDGGDSGLSLEVVSDDIAPTAPVAATQRMQAIGEIDEDLDFNSGSGDSGGTRRLAVEEKFAEERAFIEDDEDGQQTSVIMVDDDDTGSGDFIGTLSGAVDAGELVEDLEVSEDLEGGYGEDEQFGTAEADVIDAEDEAFSDDAMGEAVSEEDADTYAAPVARMEPRQPAWGAVTAVMVIGAAGLVATNVWLMWEGMSTMWSGAETSGPASMLISTIGSMLG